MSTDIFNEHYEVCFSYAGYDKWAIRRFVSIFVPCERGVNEKNNHAKAEEMAKIKFPGCKILSVDCCN